MWGTCPAMYWGVGLAASSAGVWSPLPFPTPQSLRGHNRRVVYGERGLHLTSVFAGCVVCKGGEPPPYPERTEFLTHATF
jgi:hypothetical protein